MKQEFIDYVNEREYYIGFLKWFEQIDIKGKPFLVHKETGGILPIFKEELYQESIEDLWMIFDNGTYTDEHRRNKELILKYPWLISINRWTGTVSSLEIKEGVVTLDYEWHPFRYIEADWLYNAAPETFMKFQDELLQNMIDSGEEDRKYYYKIVDTKEKYGTLRWYSNGASEEIQKIEDKWVKKLEDEMGMESWR